MKIGKDLFEIPFDPARHIRAGCKFSREFFRQSQLVTILGIDSRSLILKSLRVATFPQKFLDSLYLTYAHFEPHMMYSDIYEVFKAPYSQLPLEKVWEMAEKSGSFGEKG